MPTASRIYAIDLGDPTVVESTVTILGSGTLGTSGALRILTHPDDANFPALTYYRNPDDDFNIDNDVLLAPISQVVVTEGTTQVVSNPRFEDDAIVTEVWNAGGGIAAMPTSFFRLLYEYLVNPPAYDPLAQTYITWQPRDRNPYTYNVLLVSLIVGRGRAGQEFHIRDRTEPGGAEIPTALSNIDPGVATGLLEDSVTLVMKIVGKVES